MAGLPLLPPRRFAPNGAPRRVGVEIEYAGPDCAETADLVCRLFGGTVEEVDPHRYAVRGTRFGDFTVELDMSAAHPEKKPGSHGIDELLEETARFALGKIGSLIMPFEIAAPPLPIERLVDVDRLVEALRESGARGTEGNPLHAFGLHLNPEAAAYDAGYIVEHLKAFALLVPWLRAEIGVDFSRRFSPYIEQYPDSYARKLVDPEYRPELPELIDDYIDANPSRNRELDMFPLFAYLDPGRLFHRVRDKHVKPRPTFHYRLPNSCVDDAGWGVVTDWNRWVAVERLAADPSRLAALGRLYLDEYTEGPPERWAVRVRQWLG